MITAIVWVVATCSLFGMALGGSRRWNPSAETRAADTIVIAWSWLAMASFALSLLHYLSGYHLLAGVLVLGMLTLGATRRRVAIAVDAPIATPTWIRATWSGAVAFAAGHVIARGLLLFPVDFDTLMYHRPLIDFWLQSGSLYAGEASHWSNPGSNELWGLWAASTFRGDFLVGLINVPATVLLAVSTFDLCRLVGVGWPLSHLATLATLSNYPVINQLGNAENDVSAAALFVASACYGLRFARDGRPADLTLGAASAGLLCGIKYYALGYAALNCIVAAVVATRGRGPRDGLRVIAAFGLGIASLGGYWYLRNWAASGSPLYPMVFGQAGRFASSDYPNSWATTFLGNGRPEVVPLSAAALWRFTGPWQFAAVACLPIVTLWLIVTRAGARLRGGSRPPAGERLYLALLTLGSGAILAVTPLALEDISGSLNQLIAGYTPVRYGAAFLTLASVSFSLFLQDILIGVRKELRGLPACFAGISALFQVAWVANGHRIDWFFDVSLAIAGAACAFALDARGRDGPRLRRHPLLATALAAATIFGAGLGIERLGRLWDTQFINFYDSTYQTKVFSRLDELGESASRLGCLDFNSMPFLGPRRSVRLYQPRPVPSYDWLVRYLRRHRIQYVVVSTINASPTGWDVYAGMKDLLDEHYPEFRVDHRDWSFTLYRFDAGAHRPE